MVTFALIDSSMTLTCGLIQIVFFYSSNWNIVALMFLTQFGDEIYHVVSSSMQKMLR